MVGDGIGFACRHGGGLEIIDFTQPQTPVSISEVTTLTNSWDVELFGSYAYVADGAGGLAVINVSNTQAPIHLASLETSGSASDVVMGDNLLVVCCGSAGIDVFNLSDPANPALVGHANTSGLATTADIGAGIVYVADWGSVRGYRFEPTFDGDLHLPFKKLAFEGVPPGETEQLAFDCINTGGGPLAVTEIQTFSATITVDPPTSFTVPVGQTHQVILNFAPEVTGFDGTFVRIDSDDPDESVRIFPVVAGNDPNSLQLGDQAPDFTYLDLNGVPHSLSGHLAEVVVLAFFANL